MLKKTWFYVAPVVLAGVMVTAYALMGAEAGTDFKGNFKAKDANGDGFIDREEMIAEMTREAAEIDLPPACDGTELARRYTFSAEVLADGQFDFADANKDGLLTLEETVAAFERKRADDFLQADVDSNGYVTLTELTDAYRADEVKVSAACREAIGMQGAARAPEILAFLDRDGDNQVSLREFVNH